MKIKSLQLGIIILAVIFGGVGITKVTGLWKTTTEKVPATYTEGPFKGQYNPLDIRGSYSFGDIITYFEVPAEDMAIAFGLDPASNISEFKCKDLETKYLGAFEDGIEIGTGSVRYFVALYRGLPYELEEDTYLLKPAVDLLKAKASLTAEQITYLDSHTIDLAKSTAPNKDVNQESTKTPVTESDKTTAVKDGEPDTAVNGKTTFKNLIDMGAEKSDIEAVLKGTISNTGQLVKDYCSEKGIKFADVKGQLEALVKK